MLIGTAHRVYTREGAGGTLMGTLDEPMINRGRDERQSRIICSGHSCGLDKVHSTEAIRYRGSRP